MSEWYNKTHLPDVLETRGAVRAVRFENLNPTEGKGRYLAAYEIEADNLESVMKTSNENMEKKAAEGCISPLINVT